MKIISEITGQIYPTVAECMAAEKAYELEQKEKEAKEKALAMEKEKRAAEVAQAYKDIEVAQKHYINLKAAFDKDYGISGIVLTPADQEENKAEHMINLFDIIKSMF